MILQSHWSLPLLENKHKKYNFVYQTVSSQVACRQGYRSAETSNLDVMCIYIKFLTLKGTCMHQCGMVLAERCLVQSVSSHNI